MRWETRGWWWVKGSGPEPHFIFMQLLIFVEAARRSPVTLLRCPVLTLTLFTISFFSHLCDRAHRLSSFCLRCLIRLLPRTLSLSRASTNPLHFASGWRVTSLSKNGRCRLLYGIFHCDPHTCTFFSLHVSCSGSTDPAIREPGKRV